MVYLSFFSLGFKKGVNRRFNKPLQRFPGYVWPFVDGDKIPYHEDIVDSVQSEQNRG